MINYVDLHDQLRSAAAVLAAMADLGPSHRIVMECLENKPDDEYWTDDELPEHVDLPRSIVGISISALYARGLVRTHAGWGGGMPWSITDLGRVVLEALREAEQSVDEPA
jgi:DNA-binding MarR family transcriptional regulator